MYYAGLDVHTQYVTIAVVDKSGTLVLEKTVTTREPHTLLATLAPYRPLEVVVETCGFWPWVHDLLEPEGIAVRLAHAKQLRAIAHSAQKTDAVDARLLARMLATGLIPEAYPRSAAQRELLCLVRHRAALVRTRTRLANRIHGHLQQHNIVLAREQVLRPATRAWLATTAGRGLSAEHQAVLATHFTLIDAVTAQLRPLDRRLAEVARTDATAALVRTIPGIGPYWAVLLSAELQPIGRFRRPAALVSYAGLAPRTRSSGGHTRHGAIPAGANRWVRWALVSAIPTHLRLAPTSPLSTFYGTLKARVGWRVARVATARKLARCVYQMLRTGETWRAIETPDGEGRVPVRACSTTTASTPD